MSTTHRHRTLLTRDDVATEDGLRASDIANIPIFYNRTASCPRGCCTTAQDDDLKCVICMESIKIGKPYRRLLCSHKFHPECIFEWLSISNKCPLCLRPPLPSRIQQQDDTQEDSETHSNSDEELLSTSSDSDTAEYNHADATPANNFEDGSRLVFDLGHEINHDFLQYRNDPRLSRISFYSYSQIGEDENDDASFGTYSHPHHRRTLSSIGDASNLHTMIYTSENRYPRPSGRAQIILPRNYYRHTFYRAQTESDECRRCFRCRN